MVDTVIIVSGILLAISLFIMASLGDECTTCSIRVRALQSFLSSVGEYIWIGFMALCFIVFIGAFTMKMTHRGEKAKKQTAARIQNQSRHIKVKSS